MDDPFIKPEWIKTVESIDLAQLEGRLTAAVVMDRARKGKDMLAVVEAAIRDGMVIVIDSYSADLDRFMSQMHNRRDIYLDDPIRVVCDDLSYLDDPKYKRTLAQYERAKLQRNKHLMRDLERQLHAFRWRY